MDGEQRKCQGEIVNTGAPGVDAERLKSDSEKFSSAGTDSHRIEKHA